MSPYRCCSSPFALPAKLRLDYLPLFCCTLWSEANCRRRLSLSIFSVVVWAHTYSAGHWPVVVIGESVLELDRASKQCQASVVHSLAVRSSLCRELLSLNHTRSPAQCTNPINVSQCNSLYCLECRKAEWLSLWPLAV